MENVAALPAVAAAARRTAAPDAAVPLPKRAGYGAVPEYLTERKSVWAVEDAARRKAAEEKAACPPGHRMMPEEERAATLALVTQSLAEAKAEVRRRRQRRRAHRQCKCESLANLTLVPARSLPRQLGALPLRVEIPSALRRKADLEAKVAKLESAVSMFSRPRIFVRE